MKKLLLIGALAALLGGALRAQDIAGDWKGTLKAGPVELRIGLHFTKTASGFDATLDSVDQGANGIPVTGVTLQGSDLKFDIAAIQGNYAGKVSADGTSITGTFTQGQSVPLDFTRGTFKAVEHKPAKPSDIDGTWTGSLNTPGGTLRVVFNIVNTEDGLTATAESPDQGAMKIPVTSVTREGSTLKIDLKAMGAAFEGTLSPDLKTATGTFTQGGNSLPLVLKR
jgi:hypothetical protein